MLCYNQRNEQLTVSKWSLVRMSLDSLIWVMLHFSSDHKITGVRTNPAVAIQPLYDPAFVEVFSERELTFTFAICCRPSVCLSVCLSSVTLVHPTQAVQIFGNISTVFGTLAIRWHPLKISRRSSQGNPSAGGVKHKRGSKI